MQIRQRVSKKIIMLEHSKVSVINNSVILLLGIIYTAIFLRAIYNFRSRFYSLRDERDICDRGDSIVVFFSLKK